MSGYLMRLICAAILCAVIRSLAGEGQGIRKLICGVFLALCVLSVPVDMKLPDMDPDKISDEARAAVMHGQDQAEEARETIIKEALAEYIWNKASELELELTIRLELTDEQTPENVFLTGSAESAARMQMTTELVQALGIGKEDVIWIEPHQSSE